MAGSLDTRRESDAVVRKVRRFISEKRNEVRYRGIQDDSRSESESLLVFYPMKRSHVISELNVDVLSRQSSRVSYRKWLLPENRNAVGGERVLPIDACAWDSKRPVLTSRTCFLGLAKRILPFFVIREARFHRLP